MITSIKRAAAEALAAVIAAGIPSLASTQGVTQRVFTRASDDDKYEVYPSLYVILGRGTFTPFPDADELWGDDGSTLFEVGCFEGPCELRAVHVTPIQREQLEQAVVEQFLCQEAENFAPDLDRDDMSSGIIVASVPNVVVRGVTTGWTGHVSLSLDSEEWREEFAFGKRRYSFMECTATWPAYRLVKGLPTIEQVVLEVEPVSDLDSDPPFADAENVQVNDDGSTSPA